MLIQTKRTTGIFLLIAATALSAGAAPNGLTQIPIAKVFTDGVADFSVERDVLNDQSTVFTTQYGLMDRFEIGIDDQTAPADERAYLGNVKYLFCHSPGRVPDMAVGVQDIASGKKAIPYLVATTQPKATGFTIGMIHADTGNAYLGLAGLSYNVTPDVQLVADYIGGSESYSTYGVIANVTKTIAVNLAYAKPNAGGNEVDGFNRKGYIVNISYTFHLKPDKREKDEDKDKKKDGGEGGKGKSGADKDDTKGKNPAVSIHGK